MLACAASFALAGCGAEPEQGSAARPSPPAPVSAAAEKQPASKRIVGRYRLSLNQIPNSALGKELAELKRKGKADQVARVEYRITETEFVLDTFGAVGRSRERFTYEILSEQGDELLLRKHGASADGPSEVKATVKPDALYIDAAEHDRVRLERVE